jgi:predicted Zn-dependent protease
MLSRSKSTIAGAARALTTLFLAAAVAVTGSVGAFAQNVPVVRDAEIEALVRDYARPIFKAAGLSNDAINIVLVNDESFNAFVAGRRLFINTGALMTAETPTEIIGVIAHEAGHIAGGHQQKLRDQLERAKTMAIIATLLGAGAIVAGATTNSRGLADAGMGVAAGGGEMAQRSILAYQHRRDAADRSRSPYSTPPANRMGSSLRRSPLPDGAVTVGTNSTPTASATRCRRTGSPTWKSW